MDVSRGSAPEFETRASLSTSQMATGMVLVVAVASATFVAAIHAFLGGPLQFALDTAVLVAAGAFVVIGGRRLVARLPHARVYEDRVAGLLGAPQVVWFRDVIGHRKEVQRYGFGPWNTEEVLWLQLAGDDVRLGREWTNHRELQARILRQLGAKDPLR